MSMRSVYAIALGCGLVIGIESWAWMRHGTSAIVLLLTSLWMLAMGLVMVAVAGLIAFAVLAGVTGWDPLDLNAPTAPASRSTSSCDENYEGACLDPDASVYDYEDGEGDGPLYTGPVEVVGTDVYGLDRDGDGYACEWS